MEDNIFNVTKRRSRQPPSRIRQPPSRIRPWIDPGDMPEWWFMTSAGLGGIAFAAILCFAGPWWAGTVTAGIAGAACLGQGTVVARKQIHWLGAGCILLIIAIWCAVKALADA